MKKNIMKKILSFVLVAVFLTTAGLFPSSAQAMSQNAENRIEAWRTQRFDDLSEQHKAIVLREFRELGLTDEEISAVLRLERDASLSKNAGKMPMRAQIGDTRVSEITITAFDIAVMGSFGLLAYLVAHGVPSAVATDIATSVGTLVENNLPFTGITVTIQYVYGYTNDGVLGWNVGPVTWRVNY